MTLSEERAELAKNIRRLITDRRMTVKDCAERAGVTHSALSRILNEPRVPSAITVRKLAKALHVSADEILGLKPTVNDEVVEKARKLVAKLDDLLWGENT